MLRKRARFSGEFMVSNANELVEIKQVYVRSSVNGNYSLEVVLTSHLQSSKSGLSAERTEWNQN